MKRTLEDLKIDFTIPNNNNLIRDIDGIRISNSFIDNNNTYYIDCKPSLFQLNEYGTNIYINNICLDEITKKYINNYPFESLNNIKKYLVDKYEIPKGTYIEYNQPNLIGSSTNYGIKV